MPTHPYYIELERHLFAHLRVVRERARTHKLTIRTCGKDTQPKVFELRRRGVSTPILTTSTNSLYEIESYLDQLSTRAEP
jgi:hypothetical protein